ncbi:MAG: hypothetical protein ABIH10_01430 [Spirochaetota bacterium]
MKFFNFSIFQSNNRNSGQVMLLTVLILGGVVLSVSMIAGYITVQKIRQSSDATNSTKAIFAADTGIEWELYKQFKGPADKPVLSNGADFETSGSEYVKKSVGRSNNAFRAFEIEFQGAAVVVPL